ncbi:MAG: TonB-dependent receptor plug domain-containing protein [Marinifilaceae bacterium]
MKKTIVTAFALLSMLNFTVKADDVPVIDTTAVRHLNLNEVKVSASRVNAKMKDLPQKVEVITKRVIGSTPAVDMGDLLKKTSGVDIIQYPGVLSSISMRGFAPTTTNKYAVILINGVPSPTKNIGSIDLGNVERVEILKGPFSAQYGSSAMAGVINIVTKESLDQIGGNIDLQYGSFNTSKIGFNIGGEIVDKVDFDFSYGSYRQGKDYVIGKNDIFGHSTIEKIILDPDSKGERMENSCFSRLNMDSRVGYKFNENWKINFKASYFLADGVETPGSFWHNYGMKKKDMERYNFGIDLSGNIGNHKLSFSPFYANDLSDSYSINSTTKEFYVGSETIYKNYGFQMSDLITLGDHSLVIGADHKTDRYETMGWKSSGEVRNSYKPDYSNASSAVYTQAHVRLFEKKLNLSAGTRMDFSQLELDEYKPLNSKESKENYNVFTYNIGVKYNFIKALAAHASFGTAFLTPDAYQMAGAYDGYYGRTVGNPNLDPEYSNTLDFGFEYKNFAKGISFDATYFQTHHNDKIVTCYLDNGDSSFENADKSDMNGLEISASYDFGAISDYNYSLKVYGNYTHLFDATVEKKKVESAMLYVRENTGNFGVEFDNLKGFTTRLNARYIGHRYEQNWYRKWNKSTSAYEAIVLEDGKKIRPELSNEAILRHPVSMIFDYSASYTFKEKYTFGLTVSNLLDENYTEKDGYNMPGRSVMGKIAVRF